MNSRKTDSNRGNSTPESKLFGKFRADLKRNYGEKEKGLKCLVKQLVGRSEMKSIVAIDALCAIWYSYNQNKIQLT